jgi:hypothetical protein
MVEVQPPSPIRRREGGEYNQTVRSSPYLRETELPDTFAFVPD